MLAGIFAALAAYERELMHERAAAAQARGRHTGWPARLTADQARHVRALRAGGEAIIELVRGFGVSRATIFRALQQPEAVQLPSITGGAMTPSRSLRTRAGCRRGVVLAGGRCHELPRSPSCPGRRPARLASGCRRCPSIGGASESRSRRRVGSSRRCRCRGVPAGHRLWVGSGLGRPPVVFALQVDDPHRGRVYRLLGLHEPDR